jgi:hypothetical protein
MGGKLIGTSNRFMSKKELNIIKPLLLKESPSQLINTNIIKPNYIIYQPLNHVEISKKFMNNIKLKEMKDNLKYLHKNKIIDDKAFSIMQQKTKFLIGFFNHGTYIKDYKEINEKYLVRITAVTTTDKPVSIDGKNKVIPIEVKGLDNKIFISGSVLMELKDQINQDIKPNKFEEFLACKAEDNDVRYLYEKGEARHIIIDNINRSGEEGKLLVYILEDFIKNVKQLNVLEGIFISSKIKGNYDLFNKTKQEFTVNLIKGRDESVSYTKEMGDKIAFFKIIPNDVEDVTKESKLSDIDEL